MSKVNTAPKVGAKGFSLVVLPTLEALEESLADNGKCHPRKCWHRVTIYAILQNIDPGENHYIRVDAGHIKIVYGGWRYIADTPRHVKRSLMLFDAGRYDEVHRRQYTLRFRRTTKIKPLTRERKDIINANRDARVAAGGQERKKAYNLRARVAGFSGIV